MQASFLNIPSHPDVVFTVYPPVGILSMAACLKQAGYGAAFIDADVLRLSPEQVVARLARNLPDFLGISLNVAQVSHAAPYIAAVQRAFPELPLVVGGPYVTGVREGIFTDFPTVPYAVLSEGEYAIIDFAEYLQGLRRPEQVRNLLWRQENEIRRNPVERIADLDSLPLPDYSLVKETLSLYPGPQPAIALPSIAIMCTRGCPYNCTFCSSPVSWERKVTFRSTDSIIRELEYLRDLAGVREVFFQDDTMNVRPSWFMELCDKIIARGLQREIFFKCPFRLDKKLLTRELLDKAKAANFWMIFYGVESGNRQMLQRMHKQTVPGDIERAFALTRKAGIASYASFMIGNDGETGKTVRDSLRLARRIMPDYGGFAVAAPFPGSELHRIGMAKGHITRTDFTKYQFGDCILRTEELSVDEITSLAIRGNAVLEKQKKTLRYRFISRNNPFVQPGQLYPPEWWHTWVQWSGRSGWYLIMAPAEASVVHISCLALHPDIEYKPVKLTVSIGSARYTATLGAGEWQTLSFPLPAGAITPSGQLMVRWKTDRTWTPAEADIQNKDNRRLGIAVERIWVS